MDSGAVVRDLHDGGIDEDDKEERAEDAALRDAGSDWPPVGGLIIVHCPDAPVGEEGGDPSPGFAGDASLKEGVEEIGVPYSVEGFLKVKEDYWAVLSSIGGLCSAYVLDGGQEVLDGIIGAPLFTEAKLKRVEVVGVVQESHQFVVD